MERIRGPVLLLVGADDRPSAIGTLDLGGTPFVNSAASAQAWQDVLAFLQRLG